jgi:copper chaperone CopZ
VSYKDGEAVVTVDDAVAENDLLDAIKKAGPYSGTIKQTDKPE